MKKKVVFQIVLSLVIFVLAIVFVSSSWSSMGIFNSPITPSARDNVVSPDLQQAASEKQVAPLVSVDTYRCFSWRHSVISNVTELPDGSREWTSTWIWNERPADFCSPNSDQNYEWLDLTRLNAYTYDDGKPRHTEFRFINGTVASLNPDDVVRYSSK